MGALYHLKQRLVDFCNVIQQNANRTDTVPSSAVLYSSTVSAKDTLPTNTDLNSVTTIGMYTLSESNTYANMPSDINFGMLEVTRGHAGSNFISQRISQSGGKREFFRSTSNGGTSWSAWQEVATKEQITAYVATESVQGTITKADRSRSSVTAPTKQGYTFVTWYMVMSKGWVGNLYIETPRLQTTNVWSANYGFSDSNTGEFIAFALYVKTI